MFKSNVLVITLTTLLSACASSSTSLTEESKLNKDAKSNSGQLKTNNPPIPTEQGICEANSKYIDSSLPLVDFENSTLDYKKGFLPNGVLICSVLPDSSYPAKYNVKHFYEIGNFQGFDYKVGFSGGFVHLSSSPNTSKWKINCEKDAMESTVTCSMKKHGKVPLFVHLASDGETTSLGLMTETYPNTEIAIKVGSNDKIAATSMAELLSKYKITEQMKTSNKLITSYYTWPYNVKKVESHSIEGFSAGLTLMKKLHTESKFY